MATHASAEKRNRQRITRTERNQARKSSLRTSLKKARAAVQAKTKDASESVRAASSALDRAASKGVVPAKRASRVKARLARALHKASRSAS